MKKLISLIVMIIFALFLCACNSSQTEAEHNHDHDHSHETQAATSVTETTEDSTDAQTNLQTEPQTDTDPVVSTADATGPLSSKHSGKIDVPFESEYTQAKTDAEKVQICDKYRKEWEKTANRYLNEILYYNGDVPAHTEFSTDKEMHEYVGFRNSDFLSYYETDSKNYLAQMEEQYGKGDKANAMCAKYKFDLQRSFALEMIEIYELLGEFNGQEF